MSMSRIFTNSPKLFEWIIDAYPDTIKLVSVEFLNYLINRCYNGIVERLINGGVEINTSGTAFHCPLLTAFIYNRKVVPILLKRKDLDLDIYHFGDCAAALSRICLNFSIYLFGLALKNPSVGKSSQDYTEALEHVCLLGCIDRLGLIFTRPNVQVSTKMLSIAMRSICCKTFIQMLVGHPSVDINFLNESKETPFVTACKLNRQDFARTISNHPGFDPALICLGKRQIDHAKRWRSF